MRTSRLFLGIFALALLLPLLLLACAGSDQPTAVPSSERATAEPTDLPDSEWPTDEPETPTSPARMPSTLGSGAAPTATGAPATAPPAASGSAETDREALVALYNAAAGPNWISNNNWLTDVPIGEWSGVTTDDNGRVTELDLSSNQLTGEIPPELGNLANLQELGLGGNQLSGEIPPELGNLANLQELGLSGNQLSGEIPPELGNLANLTELFLGGNQLSGCVPNSLSGRFVYSDLGGLQFCP